MGIDRRQEGDVSIVKFSGKITIGAGQVGIRDAVLEELANGSLKLLLDFEEVDMIDSTGIGELVAGLVAVNNRGGSLKLLKVPPKMDHILELTQLKSQFEQYASEEEAIGSFG